MNVFRLNLKYLLEKFGVRQAQVGLFIGKSQNSISNWINNVSVPDLRDLVGISQFFGVSIDAMTFEDLAKANLITTEHLEAFRTNNKRRTIRLNASGKPIAQAYYTRVADSDFVLNESEPGIGQSILTQLKNMEKKLDMIQAGKFRSDSRLR